MAERGGRKNLITKITSRLRPGTAPSKKPASIELEQGAIKTPSVPRNVQGRRALNQLKKGLGRPVDGVGQPQKTPAEEELEKLNEQAGIPSVKPKKPEPIGGSAIEPRRSAQTEDLDQENPEEEDSGDEEPDQPSPAGQTGGPAAPPEEQEGPPPEQNDDGGDGVEPSEGKGGPNIRNTVVNRVSDAVKKAAIQAGKKIASFFAKNPYAWLFVLGLIVVAILGFLLFNYLMGTANQNPSPTGQSMTQAYDPVKDRPTLQAVLQLSGDKAVQELSAWQFTLKLQNELESLRGDMNASTRPDKDQIIGKIDAILGDIQTYGIAKDSKTAKKIIDGVKELYEMFGTLPSIADAGSPLPKGSIVGYTNNFHDGTPMKPCPAGGCPKGHRTFYQSERNTCDATDLKAKNGTPVFAAFGGKVAKKGSDGKNGQLVFIENNAGYLAVYAHITDSSLALNETVKTGQQIGKVGSGHLHFELAKDGKCVASIPQDKTDAKLNNKSVGYYLWLRMAKVLNNAI